MNKVNSFLKKLIILVIGRPNFIRKLQWRNIEKLLINDSDSTCIDIGSGSLYYTEKLNKFNFRRVYAVDLYFENYIKEKAKSSGIYTIEGDAQEKLPLEGNIADLIILSSVLHMVDNPNKLLDECCRLLKKDGFIIISTPNKYRFLPKIFSLISNKFFNKILRLPKTYDHFLELLSDKFGTGSKKGYLSENELKSILDRNALEINSKEYAPGFVGSFLWEVSLIFYLRFGDKVFYLLYLFTPLVMICDYIYNNQDYSCEHIWRVKKNDISR